MRVTSSNTKPEVVLSNRCRHLEIVYDVINPPPVARFGRNFVAWCGIACGVLWYGRSSNRNKNSNMADIVFFQTGISYISAVNWDMSTKFGLYIDFDLWNNVMTLITKPEVVLHHCGCYLEIAYYVITLPWIAQIGRNLVIWCKIVRRLLWCGQNRKGKTNSNMADVCFFLNGSSCISVMD